ncbi:MAG TPA: carboxypeptidase regulatory-like domain-containing protein [Bryobacteraceae bacterium]|nr:carboxypeptidase regulatory-like domain-containing protein [Bryobacteraceae bacterium]
MLRARPAYLFALLFGVAAVSLNAADVTGAIDGVVKDASGAVAPGVEVTATNTGTNAVFRATTDATGLYSILGLPAGLYQLTAEPKGFRRFIAKDLRVQVNETLRVDIPLEVGDIAQSVEVSGAVQTVDTESITLRNVVDEQRIENLPLNGRNPTQLMQLVAGVQADVLNSNVTSGTTYPGVTPVSVNGGRANTTNYILDGAEDNDHYSNAPNPMPDPDALQEFSVQTNTFSAEFGRNVGGIVNAVTRSGTNALHGSAFEYVRNNDLNAANFFAPINANGGKQSDGLKRNQYGATVGGPVYLPKIYDGRNKTFFFFSFQGTKVRQAPSKAEQQVPTNEERNGDFSALGHAIYDPASGVPFPNNQIPATDFNPISAAILKNYIPAPAAGQSTIDYALPNNLDDNQFMVRGDQNITDRHRLSGRFFTSKANQQAFLAPGNYFSSQPGAAWRNTSVAVTDTYTISPTVVNTALFSYNRTNNLNQPIYPAQGFADLGAQMYNDKTPEIYLQVNGYFLLDTNDTNSFLREEYQANDTLRWTKGQHQLSMGVEYGHGLGDINNDYRANGYFTFDGSAPFTTDALADFMLGKFYNLEQGVGEYKNTRFNIVSAFVQDSYRVSRRLTLDLGLRWDPFFPYTDEHGKLAAYFPGQQSTRYVNAPPGILYAGDPGVPPGVYPRRWANLGPRVGFAWDVFGDGKTAVRGGYGIYYDRPNTISTNSQADQAPFGTVVNVSGNANNSLSSPYAGGTNPFPASITPPRDVQFVLPDVAYMATEGLRNAQLQSWNLTIERQLPGNMVARVAYAASKGTHLASLREGNAAIYSPGATSSTTDERRPMYPDFGQMTLVEPGDNSSYQSLQLNLERRFSNRFTILANYTFAKSIDTSSYNKQTGQTVTDPFDRAFDRGLSDFNHKQVFNLSGLWDLPVKLSGRAANALLGGWQLSGIVSAHSGQPFPLYSDVDNSYSGVGTDRPDLIGDPYISGSRSRGQQIQEWLNPAAFTTNALGTFGNVGRNVFIGPGFVSTDLSLQKEFPIAERAAIQFRAEAFNAFNRVNLQNPTGDLLSGNFMVINSAFDPRILQFALRLKW